MATTQSSDMFMMLIPNQSSLPVRAESTTDLLQNCSASNPLLKGFTTGYVFEIESFSFKVGTDGSEAKKGDVGKRDLDENALKQLAKRKGIDLKELKDLMEKNESSAKGGYQKWRSGEAMDGKYPVDIQPVKFAREIDQTSFVLMRNLINGVRYSSGALVKRKAAGTAATGEVFMRLDFVDVVVTGIDWSDNHEVKETVQFICRGITFQYSPQMADGSLGAVVSAQWAMPDNTQ